MEQLLLEYENKLDHTNLLDVSYAVASLFSKLNEHYDKSDDVFKKEEYGLYIFYTNNLLNDLKNNPDDKEDIFATAHSMLLSCIEI